MLYCLYGNIAGIQKGGHHRRGEAVGTMTLELMFLSMMVVVKPSKMKGVGKKMGLLLYSSGSPALNSENKELIPCPGGKSREPVS